ncbi:F-box only protein 47 [Nymphon striatum]|nr:F-box only protein 47 [Nymphon striatum]
MQIIHLKQGPVEAEAKRGGLVVNISVLELNDPANNQSSTPLEKSLILACCGEFFQILVAGWHESECAKVFENVEQFCSIKRDTLTVLDSSYGKDFLLENVVRKFYRLVVLDTYEDQPNSRAFWLTNLLKPFTIFQQAKLLLILYGPIFKVDWYLVIHSTSSSQGEARRTLIELSKAVRLLHQYTKEWSQDDIISIIEDIISKCHYSKDFFMLVTNKITAQPGAWHIENVAILLFFCGSEISITFIGSRAINGRALDVAELTAYLCFVCHKFHFCIEYAVKILNGVIDIMESDKDKAAFLYNIVTYFQEKILDLHESTMLEVEDGELLTMWVYAQALFSGNILRKAFIQKDNR